MTASKIDQIQGILSEIVLGKEAEVRLALACLLSKGHLLIEDVPGVGKTTLVQALARLMGFDLARIQCTNDLLPAEITGTNLYVAEKVELEFRPGLLVNHFAFA